jgi:nicotinic acid mononucleotide adenylyltransferase
MRRTESAGERVSDADGSDSLRDLNPWREVGWIFKDGESIAVERQGTKIRIRTMVD